MHVEDRTYVRRSQFGGIIIGVQLSHHAYVGVRPFKKPSVLRAAGYALILTNSSRSPIWRLVSNSGDQIVRRCPALPSSK